jgi:hypothetical protein
MFRFADECRQKACANGYAYHCELRENFNMLLTKRFICSTTTKNLGDSFEILSNNTTNGFKFQLKVVLDSAVKIFPLLTCQFIDLLQRFEHWENTKEITLMTLSKICDHLRKIVRASEIQVQINREGFASYVNGPVNCVDDKPQPEKSK